MLLIAINKHGVSLIHPQSKVTQSIWHLDSTNANKFSIAGHTRNTSIYSHIELVVGQHILPHDHRQFSAWLEAVMRDIIRIQNGRLIDIVHLINASKYE